MKIRLENHEMTQRFGEFLGRRANTGDVIAARGELGAGKTCLAQGVAVGLEVPAEHYVNSPTFAILQIHPGRAPFYHMDLYRIGDEDELLGLGLEECIGGDGVAYIEWPERVPMLVPEGALEVELQIVGAARVIHLRSWGGGSSALLDRVCKDAHMFRPDA